MHGDDRIDSFHTAAHGKPIAVPVIAITDHTHYLGNDLG